MNEIEIKFRVADFQAVKRLLALKGCVLSSPVTQEDIVFAKNIGSVQTFIANDMFLRIRESDGRCIFTVKKPIRRDILSKQEAETVIQTKDQMIQAITLMGFQEAVRNKKVRQTGKYREFEICVDRVEDLGDFIEIEKHTNGDVDDARKEIEKIAAEFGLRDDDEMKEGYDILVLRKMRNS